MKLSQLHEDGHWDVIPNHPGGMGGSKKKKRRKRRSLTGVPKQWDKGYHKKTKVGKIKV